MNAIWSKRREHLLAGMRLDAGKHNMEEWEIKTKGQNE